MQLDFFAGTNVANAFFYLLNSIARFTFIRWVCYFGEKLLPVYLKKDYKISKLQHRIELCAVYWHFLLAVWFVLFGLMLFT